jgi:rare lipoprotein A
MTKAANILMIIVFILTGGCVARSLGVRTACKKPYTIKGRVYHPMASVQKGFTCEGTASWYGPGFVGKPTSSGEIYNMHAMTAAHPTLPMNSLVRITNMVNGREVVVRVNDRGPFVSDRVIDLSFAAAGALDMLGPGTAPVRLTVVDDGTGTTPLPGGTVFASAYGAPNPFYTPATAASGASISKKTAIPGRETPVRTPM